LKIRAARAVLTPWLCRKTMISRTAFCSAQAERMLAARIGPMPSISRSRSGVDSMISKTFHQKRARAAWHRQGPRPESSRRRGISRCHLPKSAAMCAGTATRFGRKMLATSQAPAIYRHRAITGHLARARASDSLIVLLIPAAPNDSPQSRPVLRPPHAPQSPRLR
jgi:hypothetical protein